MPISTSRWVATPEPDLLQTERVGERADVAAPLHAGSQHGRGRGARSGQQRGGQGACRRGPQRRQAGPLDDRDQAAVVGVQHQHGRADGRQASRRVARVQAAELAHRAAAGRQAGRVAEGQRAVLGDRQHQANRLVGLTAAEPAEGLPLRRQTAVEVEHLGDVAAAEQQRPAVPSCARAHAHQANRASRPVRFSARSIRPSCSICRVRHSGPPGGHDPGWVPADHLQPGTGGRPQPLPPTNDPCTTHAERSC
jgi:hypothetical protein